MDLMSEFGDLPPGCVPSCGACPDRAFPLAASLARKRARAARALARWEGVLGDLISVSGEKTLEYRDRVALAARRDGEGGWRFGMEGGGSRFLRPRPFVTLHECPVHTPRVRRVMALLAHALPPDEPEGRFPLAFLAVSGAQCTLVVKSRQDPGTDWVFASRDGRAPLSEGLAAAGMEGLWIHLHPAAGVHLFAKGGWKLAWGVPRSRDCRGFLYGPSSFSQLLPELHGASLEEAEAFLRPAPGDAVLDLYCGIGASLSLWGLSGARTLGVEAGGEAAECAAINAPTSQVLRGSCSDRIPQFREFLLSVPPGRRAAYVNPPRTGLEPGVARALAEEIRPARLAYLSCSPGTLARDLAILEPGGYRVKRLSPYDFFPRTAAVEVLALLERREG